MKNLFLIRGVSGSGKSTLAELLKESLNDAIRTEADDFFVHWVDGTPVYRFDPSLLPAAHEQCRAIVHEEMGMGTPNIIVSNTFCTWGEMEPYRMLARQYGYVVTEIIVKTDLTDDELAERNRHGLSAQQIARQRRRFQP